MIYTLGHSRHPIERFIALLSLHGIAVLADVRSTPYSRFSPQFNQKALARSLAEQGIEYQFFGESLGARTKDPACYVDGQVSYARLAATAAFQEGLARLQAVAAERRTAIMCAEKEPLDCHRTILVGRELRRRGVAVTHILESGALETQEEALARLRGRLKIAGEDLLRGVEAADEEAYEAQGRKMGYRI